MTLIELADAYAQEVADTPHNPTPRERALAVSKIEKTRAALVTAIEAKDAEIADLLAEVAQLRTALNGVMYWNNGKPEWDAAIVALGGVA